MAEPIYERSRIVSEIQTRFAVKQKEVGSSASPIDVTMRYFTGPLGAEQVTRLLKQKDPNGVAMHMQDAYQTLSPSAREDYVQAIGSGIAGVLGYRLGRTVIHPWKTHEFMGDVYDLFFAKAHLNKPAIVAPDESSLAQFEGTLVGLDVLTTRAIRNVLTPPAGETPGKIGDFFKHNQSLRDIPSIDLVVGSWIHPSLTTRVIESGQHFQAALDAISLPKRTRPRAIDFLAKFDL